MFKEIELDSVIIPLIIWLLICMGFTLPWWIFVSGVTGNLLYNCLKGIFIKNKKG